MIQKRRRDQARYEFDIKGITNEIPFSDIPSWCPRGEGDLELPADPNWMAPFESIERELDAACDAPSDPSPVQAALESLPPRWRQAVELHLEGKTQSEAASEMGITQPRYYEILKGKGGEGGALGRLREILTAQGYGPKDSPSITTPEVPL